MGQDDTRRVHLVCASGGKWARLKNSYWVWTFGLISRCVFRVWDDARWTYSTYTWDMWRLIRGVIPGLEWMHLTVLPVMLGRWLFTFAKIHFTGCGYRCCSSGIDG